MLIRLRILKQRLTEDHARARNLVALGQWLGHFNHHREKYFQEFADYLSAFGLVESSTGDDPAAEYRRAMESYQQAFGGGATDGDF